MPRRPPVVVTGRWPSDLWREAVWNSPKSSLKPLQRLIALAYADHARDGEVAWVTYNRLEQRTGLSRDAVARHLGALVEAGWLVLVSPASQHRSARYRLVIPSAQQSVAQTAEPVQQSVSRTTELVQQSVSADQQSVSAVPAVRETDSTSVPTSVPTSSTDLVGGRGAEEDGQDRRIAQAADALRAAVPPAAVLSRAAHASLVACLRRGWTQEALVQAVATPSWEGSTHPPALLARRLADCAEQSPPRPALVRPPWCGHCHESTRMTDDDRPGRCHCHPLRAGEARRRVAA